MGLFQGEASTDIDAPISKVFEAAADVEASPAWQPEIKLANCLEHDARGRQMLVHTETDTKVRVTKAVLRFSYQEPTRVEWRQEKGDVSSLFGRWTFEDLGGERTRATFKLEVDFGRVLNMLIKGPVVELLRRQLIYSMPEKLKRYVEAAP